MIHFQLLLILTNQDESTLKSKWIIKNSFETSISGLKIKYGDIHMILNKIFICRCTMDCYLKAILTRESTIIQNYH